MNNLERLNLDQYEHIEFERIYVKARPGARIDKCLKECLELCVTQWKIVELTHNDRMYKIYPDSLYRSISGIEND